MVPILYKIDRSSKWVRVLYKSLICGTEISTACGPTPTMCGNVVRIGIVPEYECFLCLPDSFREYACIILARAHSVVAIGIGDSEIVTSRRCYIVADFSETCAIHSVSDFIYDKINNRQQQHAKNNEG